jgi:hypothetical protein
MVRRPPVVPQTPPSFSFDQRIDVLKRQKNAAERLLQQPTITADEHHSWNVVTRGWLEKAYGSESGNISAVLDAVPSFVIPMGSTEEYREHERRRHLKAGAHVLGSLIEQLEIERSFAPPPPTRPSVGVEALLHVERLCERFHSVAREIRARHGERPTLDVTDEYDVQDLLRGLLRIFFDDLRSEEWTPSHAGASSRMDFLLKRERVVVETKMARKGLDSKKLGEELIVDIARYGVHQDCGTLVCFVYDPTGLIRNPAAIENDLTKVHGDLAVRVFIRPRH